jgi:hypothetical protein
MAYFEGFLMDPGVPKNYAHKGQEMSLFADF